MQHEVTRHRSAEDNGGMAILLGCFVKSGSVSDDAQPQPGVEFMRRAEGIEERLPTPLAADSSNVDNCDPLRVALMLGLAEGSGHLIEAVPVEAVRDDADLLRILWEVVRSQIAGGAAGDHDAP